MAQPVVFNCYIDESGDEGYQFPLRSSPWFFLTSVIVRPEHEIRESTAKVKGCVASFAAS